MAPQFTKMKNVMDQTGLSRSTILRMVKTGRFPAPVQLDGNVLYRSRAVARFLKDLDQGIDMPDGKITRYTEQGEIVTAA